MSKKKKQYVLVSYSFLPIFETLVKQNKASKVAELTIAILKYDMDGTEPEFTDDSVSLVWSSVIKPILDANKKKYAEVSKARAEAVSNRYRNKYTEATIVDNCIQTDTNATDIDIDYDVDVDINNNLNNPNGLFVALECNDGSKKNEIEQIKTAWNNLPVAKITAIRGNRLKQLKTRLNEYGLDDVLSAINNIPKSPHLLGENNRGWQITFDWFIKPNNFPKVLEGNYIRSVQPQGRNDVQTGYQKMLDILGGNDGED